MNYVTNDKFLFETKTIWFITLVVYFNKVEQNFIPCYRPQRSCEGYVFTGVCLSTVGVSAPGGVCSGGVCSGGVCSGGCVCSGGGDVCSRGVSALGGVCSGVGGVCSRGVCSGGLLRGVSVPGGLSAPGGGCLLCTEATGRDGHCCGRYASYWNAFLSEQ